MSSAKLNEKSQSRPDIAKETKAAKVGTLDKVGMSAVEQPVLVRDQNGNLQQSPALCDLYVSLDDPHAKGIHMSRLYANAQKHLSERELNMETMVDLIAALLKSHESLSYTAYAKVSFDYAIKRPSLISDNSGFRFYPVSLVAQHTGKKLELETHIRITYSSTCPCSAALARQLLQQKFLSNFSDKDLDLDEIATWISKEENQVATPHGQRSYADLKIKFSDLESCMSYEEIIDLVEKSLATPVQAMVKREDEQEFARLNGENLMFSEDAARKIKNAFDSESRISDYFIHVQHIESLHPHDAVVITTKGVPGGFTA